MPRRYTMFLTAKCQRLTILEASPVDALKMMRGSPASLVGLSALLGLLVILVLFPLFVNPVLLVQSVLPALVLGLTGAWQFGKHRKAGSLTILAGGLFAPFSYFLLATAPDYASLLVYFLILEWWSLVLILAGVSGLSLRNDKSVKDDAEEQAISCTCYLPQEVQVTLIFTRVDRPRESWTGSWEPSQAVKLLHDQ